MSNWWKYTLTGVGGLVLGGVLGGLGGTSLGLKKGFDNGFNEGHEKGHAEGYKKGYDESEPEIYVLNYNLYGVEGLCVMRNQQEAVCALDKNNDGAVDVVVLDWETKTVKEEKFGKRKVCVKNGYEVVCTLDLDNDPLPDTVVMDLKERKIKEIKYGKDTPLENRLEP